MKVTLAHQLRAQLPSYLQDATASARTKICFQLKADDAKEMAQYFPAPDDGRLEKVEEHAVAALLHDPGPDGYVRLFTNMYLRPLLSHRKGGKIKIAQAGIPLKDVLWLGYQDAQKAAKEREIIVEDPTQYLDDLLRDVMQQRDPDLPIPPKVVVGFANSGRGFYGAVKHLRPCAELSGDYRFPRELVNGDRWLREPKNDYEQFLHFVFVLRQAMRALAARPIGRKAEASTAAVAQLLTQLPRRHALVRSGDDVGRIHTYDTPPKLEGQALEERVRMIRDQTRAKYCHSHAQVQKLWQLEREPERIGNPLPATLAELAEIAGWGQVGEP